MLPAEMETEHGLIRAYLIANLSTCVLFMSLVKELSNRPARIQVNHRTIGEDVYVSVTWLPYREEI